MWGLYKVRFVVCPDVVIFMSIAFTKKMQKITFRQRIRYWFDNTMSKGAVSLLLWLAVASALLIVGASLLVKFGLKPEWAEGGAPGHV